MHPHFLTENGSSQRTIRTAQGALIHVKFAYFAEKAIDTPVCVVLCQVSKVEVQWTLLPDGNECAQVSGWKNNELKHSSMLQQE